MFHLLTVMSHVTEHGGAPGSVPGVLGSVLILALSLCRPAYMAVSKQQPLKTCPFTHPFRIFFPLAKTIKQAGTHKDVSTMLVETQDLLRKTTA